jgi:hypothetical protein
MAEDHLTLLASLIADSFFDSEQAWQSLFSSNRQVHCTWKVHDEPTWACEHCFRRTSDNPFLQSSWTAVPFLGGTLVHSRIGVTTWATSFLRGGRLRSGTCVECLEDFELGLENNEESSSFFLLLPVNSCFSMSSAYLFSALDMRIVSSWTVHRWHFRAAP